MALVGLVFACDLLWSLIEGSTGTLVYGLVDEPAHLATCAVALLAVAAAVGSRLSKRFVVAALVASLAIDVDHIPGYLGSHLLTGTLPRPYTHSLLLVAALVAVGWASRRRRDVSQISLGLAFGVSAHLFRDLATGPGVPLAWPISDGVFVLPYAIFGGALVFAAAAAAATRSAPVRRRLGVAATLVVATVAVLVILPRPTAMAQEIGIGAYIPNADNNPALIDQFGREIGHQPVLLSSYKDWSQAPFVGKQLDQIWSHGAMPMITWEPWTSSGNGISLWAIANGSYDAYVRPAARAAASWGRPLMLRFAQEMNGTWFPWSDGAGGNTPRAFKAAWRHLVRIFREEGARNVKWVWTPYAEIGGRLGFVRFFPGGRWVDWAGLDGINWGGSLGWRSFKEIFARSYHKLLRLTSRPLILAEVGCGEVGGRKAAWVSTMMTRQLPRMPHVRAVVFWSAADYRGDFRVDSSPAALRAVREAARAKRYRASLRLFRVTPRHLRSAGRAFRRAPRAAIESQLPYVR